MLFSLNIKHRIFKLHVLTTLKDNIFVKAGCTFRTKIVASYNCSCSRYRSSNSLQQTINEMTYKREYKKINISNFIEFFRTTITLSIRNRFKRNLYTR